MSVCFTQIDLSGGHSITVKMTTMTALYATSNIYKDKIATQSFPHAYHNIDKVGRSSIHLNINNTNQEHRQPVWSKVLLTKLDVTCDTSVTSITLLGTKQCARLVIPWPSCRSFRNLFKKKYERHFTSNNRT